ncbi:MAG: type II toxin-antitoxin system RelE/ParE family toxin [Steroidobacteraceae bacterium]
MIKGFRCAETRALFETGKRKRFSAISKIATRKLAQLDAAETSEFLRSPPGNRLESLKGDRKGQFSIRINDQYRVCFCWTSEGPTDVEIVDYH